MKIGFTDNIKPFHLAEMPFKTIYYKTRDAKGSAIFGRGATEFVDKRFFKKFDTKEYDFRLFVNYNPEDTTLREAPVVKNVIDYDIEMNEVLEGRATDDFQKQLEAERAELKRLAQTDFKMANSLINEPEIVDDVEIEIDKNV